MALKKTIDSILYLHNYFPVRSERHNGISSRIIDFKRGEVTAVRQFSTEMQEALEEYGKSNTYSIKDTVLCIVPSHKDGFYSYGLTKMADNLISHFGMIDGTSIIKRITLHEQNSTGGDRSIQKQLETLCIDDHVGILAGKNVMVLDDIVTTGNTIEAVRRLLREKQVNSVLAITIGKTFDDTQFIAVPQEYDIDRSKDKNMYPYELDGQKYFYNRGKWLYANYISAPLELAGRLNRLLLIKDYLLDKTVEQLLRMLDDLDVSLNMCDAIVVAERALEIADPEDIKIILPIVIGLYTKTGNPRKAVNTAKRYTDMFKKDVWSYTLFVNVAEAYCDMKDFETAKKFADIAREMAKGNEYKKLGAIYLRIMRDKE